MIEGGGGGLKWEYYGWFVGEINEILVRKNKYDTIFFVQDNLNAHFSKVLK